MRIIQIESSEHHADGAQPVQIISPLERLSKTKSIWFLPQVTREESSKLLHNKKPGVSSRFITRCYKVIFLQNFIIRGSRKPKTLAISIKIGKKQNDQVQHFIIIQSERKVSLEDSDIKFDNVVSLAFHYSNIWQVLRAFSQWIQIIFSATSSLKSCLSQMFQHQQDQYKIQFLCLCSEKVIMFDIIACLKIDEQFQVSGPTQWQDQIEHLFL